MDGLLRLLPVPSGAKYQRSFFIISVLGSLVRFQQADIFLKGLSLFT